jgi:hypothetical protein
LTKHTILFLAANPHPTDRLAFLALDQEARAIQVELERSGHRDHFELVTRWAAQPLDLLRELRKLKPTVVHFSGHGGRLEPDESRPVPAQRDVVGVQGAHNGEPPQGLFFQRPDGRPQLVSTAAIQETFGAAGASVKVVVLSACYSEAQTEALLAHVDCVVAMGGSISDDAARNFAIGFYGGLGERQSVLDAYLQGRVAILLEGMHDGEKPQLKVRHGVNANQLILADLHAENAVAIASHQAVQPPHEYLAPLTLDSTEAPSGPLRFAVIGIAECDRHWHRGRSHIPSPFDPPAYMNFMLAGFDHGADPQFDITLLNTTEAPVIMSAVGIEILNVDHTISPEILFRTACEMPRPSSTKIITSDIHVLEIRTLDIPMVRYRELGFGGKLVEEVSGTGSVFHRRTLWKELADPVYFEPRAPYRYSLLLRNYARHIPNRARICMCVATDTFVCRSGEIETSHL